jgi:alginate O-acetyltransferase complex protein AlgI
MTLFQIGIFSGLSVILSSLKTASLRGWLLLVISILAVYWIQPPLDIRYLDYFLSTAVLIISILCWTLTRASQPLQRTDIIALVVIAASIIIVATTRYLTPDLRITSRPPDLSEVLPALAVIAAIVALLLYLQPLPRWLTTAAIVAIIALFAILKYEPLNLWVSSLLRQWRGQDPSLASLQDLSWLGFSYVAFRLIHTLRDHAVGVLPDLTLREYLTYILFFPAYTAGPIDRAERFVADLRASAGLTASRMVEGSRRIIIGLFKKFIVADTLALISLNALNAEQTTHAGGLWLLLYAYAFRLYFDFSGYTDIAIGIGIFLGIQLPENFDRPYSRSSLTAFWQSWHITLSSWVRYYVFSPLSRALLRHPQRPPLTLILLIGHLTTMTVIGLWHGVTANFLIWGLWHGVGLFLHKLWSDRTRRWYLNLRKTPSRHRAWSFIGWFITFHYVLLGWVWFALPDFDSAVRVLTNLVGL